MGGEMFSLRPSAGGGWPAVAAALGRKLRMVEGSGPAWCATLSVADGGRNLYSQAYVQQEQPVYAEVVSDQFLEDLGGLLRPEQRAALTAAGWTDPAVSDAGRWWPNWYRYFDGPCRWEEAAQSMVFALAAILGVEDSEEVCLHVFPAASAATGIQDVA